MKEQQSEKANKLVGTVEKISLLQFILDIKYQPKISFLRWRSNLYTKTRFQTLSRKFSAFYWGASWMYWLIVTCALESKGNTLHTVSQATEMSLHCVQAGAEVSRVQWCDEVMNGRKDCSAIMAEWTEWSLYKLKVVGSILAAPVPCELFYWKEISLLTDCM